MEADTQSLKSSVQLRSESEEESESEHAIWSTTWLKVTFLLPPKEPLGETAPDPGIWRLREDSFLNISAILFVGVVDGEIRASVAGRFSALLAALRIMLSKLLAASSPRLFFLGPLGATSDLRIRRRSSSSRGLRNWLLRRVGEPRINAKF